MLLLLFSASTPAPVVGYMQVVGSDAAVMRVVGSDEGG